ncbi:DUF1284 domain-containing protein [Methanobacterium alcaliphilum]|uniref:DUF1284 domain-containing protein n=1 Tax=Methanobacterium alcaliphilum TaxID=392018 RepID=UPI00200AE0D8|nr:DUF1284 domain-containing protein [Methanobacterium alcaliphilum]MCK9150962.1 DUF1284 domain-containing protein [Methanobacterium alcaliphilum]
MKNTSKEFSGTIRIRAHHILCIQGFKGYGYSEDFVHNMTEIIDYLETNHSIVVETIKSTDDICLYCPHSKKGQCHESKDSDKRITAMDQKVIEYLGIHDNNTYSYNHLLKLLHEKIDFLKLKDICGDCSWIENCNLYLKLNNNK